MSQVISPLARGFVTLLGAGPGDPDLLTLRGLRALQRAEVILTDALVDPAFEAIFPPQAEVVFVGKRRGDHALPQSGIHALLIQHARAGRRVVRLKGGDPFIFGRGGEEALALAAARIPFEVIPGISAVNGIAAATGIPLTHRGLSREIRILEGHTERSPSEWRDLARFRGTLALYMGTRALPDFAAKLLAHGADPELPVALIEAGCTPHQRLHLGCLGDAALGLMRACTPHPGLILMGPTLPLHADLHSFHTAGIPDVLSPSRVPEPRRPVRAPGGRRQRRAG